VNQRVFHLSFGNSSACTNRTISAAQKHRAEDFDQDAGNGVEQRDYRLVGEIDFTHPTGRERQ